jgi:CHASE2 domain-containing sensor protein
VSAPAAPYVGLDHFGEGDKDFFFGRDADRRRVIFNIRASRLTLLYAESGVGKTSLLHAGVAARLMELADQSLEETGSARFLPFVFSGWRQGSTDALIAELEAQARRMLAGAEAMTLPRDGLAAALGRLAEQAGATPLVILDRFEDVLFEPEDRGFDDEFARCVTDPHLRANFLLSVRQDAMSLIGQRFKGLIPNVYGNFLHLDFLDETAAQDAVVRPIREFDRRLPRDAVHHEIEPELVETVLRQVRRGSIAVGEEAGTELPAVGPHRVETAYLQLVMQRLWDEELAAGSTVLRLSTLERLGGASRIVHAHLDDVMERLPPAQADAAAAAFRFLLTSAGRKIALSTSELREFSEADESALEPALERLEQERILRSVPAPEPEAANRREIFHDVLAPAVLDWRRRHLEEGRVALERERSRRLEVRSRRLAATAIALAAVLIGIGLYLWDPAPLQRVELATVDARFALRGERAPDPQVLIVAVDDRTLRALAPPGATVLPRAQHARLLRRVIGLGPAVVALDVIFEGAMDPAGDAALLSSMRAAGERLVLPYDSLTSRAVIQRDGTPVMRPLLLGRSDLSQLVPARFGYAGLPVDVDGRIRRADYQLTLAQLDLGQAEVAVPAIGRADAAGQPNAEEVSASTFAFAAADIARRGALRRGFDELPTAGRRAEGGQSTFTTWIDMHGPAGTVRRVSALDVLSGRVAPSVLRGRSVVIGVVPRASDDVYRAPLDGGTPMPGADLHAEAISTMLRGSPLRDAHWVAAVLTIVAIGVLPAAALVKLRPRLAVAAIAGAAAALLVAAQLAFQEGRVLIVAPPLLALLLAAVGVAALQLLRARRARSS